MEKISFICHAAKVKFKIRRDSTCTSKNVVYLPYCEQCNKQGVCFCIEWKPRLKNYKSHIKKQNPTWKTIKHFMDKCTDPKNPFKLLGF